jgi:MraZ protein
MERFVSSYGFRLDAKGRVSIPAPFRAVLTRDGFDGLYLHPSLEAQALDAGGHGLLTEIDTLIGQLAPFSDVLKVDPEGRIMLTESLKVHAGIRDAVTFVGLGHKFQIWEPERFVAHLSDARAKVKALKKELGALARPSLTQGARE